MHLLHLVCRVLLLCGHVICASGMSNATSVWAYAFCTWYVECYCCVGIWFLHLVCRVLLLCGHIPSASSMSSVTAMWACTFCIRYADRVLLLRGHIPSASGMGMYLLHPHDLSRCLVYCLTIIGYTASGLLLAYKLGYLQCINNQTIQAQVSKVTTLPVWRGVTGFIQL